MREEGHERIGGGDGETSRTLRAKAAIAKGKVVSTLHTILVGSRAMLCGKHHERFV